MGVSGELQVPATLPPRKVIPVPTEQKASGTQRRPKSLATVVCIKLHRPKHDCQKAKQQIALCIIPLACFVPKTRSDNEGGRKRVRQEPALLRSVINTACKVSFTFMQKTKPYQGNICVYIPASK